MKVVISIYASKMLNGNEIVLFMTDVSLLCFIKKTVFSSCLAAVMLTIRNACVVRSDASLTFRSHVC